MSEILESDLTNYNNNIGDDGPITASELNYINPLKRCATVCGD
jgi:hypothetical protein